MDAIQTTGIFADRPAILLLLFVALIVDGVLPNMPWLFSAVPHPVAAIRGLTAFLEQKLNRSDRSERNRLVRGGLVVVFILLLAVAAGWGADAFLAVLPQGWIGELVLLVVLISQRGVFDRSGMVQRALDGERLDDARRMVSGLVGRDTDGLDTHGVARASIEACADTFATSVVGPAFWYVLLGLPGLFLHVAVKSMDREVGYRSPRYADFGHIAARLGDAAGYIPARIAGLFLALAAFLTPTANSKAAFSVIRRDAGKHHSPNAGWPEGAVAGALGLALAGPRSYGGRKISGAWVGSGRAMANAQDLGRARYLYIMACFLHVALIATLVFLRKA